MCLEVNRRITLNVGTVKKKRIKIKKKITPLKKIIYTS